MRGDCGGCVVIPLSEEVIVRVVALSLIPLSEEVIVGVVALSLIPLV